MSRLESPADNYTIELLEEVANLANHAERADPNSEELQQRD